jgi:hypothetical protein
VLLVGLGDQPVEQGGVQPRLDLGDLAERLEPGPLPQDRRGDELELDEVRQRRAGQQPAVELEPRRLLPTQVASCLYWRTGYPSASIIERSAVRSSRSSSSSRSRCGSYEAPRCTPSIRLTSSIPPVAAMRWSLQ